MNNNSLTNYLKAQKKLKLISQSHLLELFPSLLKEEQEVLIQDILAIDIQKFKKQQALFSQDQIELQKVTPYRSLLESGSKEKAELGLKAASLGQCGSILIAGGQGTRLGHQGPKGTFPITPIYHKSLFQIFCERVKEASKKTHRDLPLAIMTSPDNDHLTRSFFEQHNYFDLKESQVYFFTQTELPHLDFEERLFLDDKTQIAYGPDGNGSCFTEFEGQGVLKKWKDLGIEYLNVVLVDNPLADPYDFELFGELIQSKSDLTLKSCTRLSSKEKVGIIVSQDKKPVVLEYHEIPSNTLFDEEPAANLSLFALTLDFSKKCAKLDLPFHKVMKMAPRFDFEIQKTVHPLKPNCWKSETYIFDILPYSKKTTVLTYPREHIFCPLKNKEGDFSPKTVRKSLLEIGIQ